MTLAMLPLRFEEEDGDIWRELSDLAPETQQELIKEAVRQFFVSRRQIEQARLAELASDSSAEPGQDSFAELKKDSSEELDLKELFIPSGQAEVKQEDIRPVNKNLKPWERLLNEVIGSEEDESVIAAIRTLQSQSLPSQAATTGFEPTISSSDHAIGGSQLSTDRAKHAVNSPEAVEESLKPVVGQELPPDNLEPAAGSYEFDLKDLYSLPARVELGDEAHPVAIARNEPGLQQEEVVLTEERRPHPEMRPHAVLKGMAHLMQVIGEEEDEDVVAFLTGSGRRSRTGSEVREA